MGARINSNLKNQLINRSKKCMHKKKIFDTGLKKMAFIKKIPLIASKNYRHGL